jgi:3-phytase
MDGAQGRAMQKILLGAVMAVSLIGCAAREVPVAVRIANALPAVNVMASAETVPVGTSKADAADDPAIWRNVADPAASLIVGTDKKAGLYVYALDGTVRHFLGAGLVNNVDLIDSGGRIFVMASDRNDPLNSQIALFTLDPKTGTLTVIGKVSSGPGEAYGICIDRGAGGGALDELMVFAAIKDGTVRQFAVKLRADTPTARLVRTMKLSTQIEGCVVDPASRSLFVGEEDVGIWRFGADAAAPTTGTLVAAADGKQLVADVEGLALAQIGGKPVLVASSQGDNAYVLFGIPSDAAAPLPMLARFRIGPGRFGATSETDGIEVMLGDFGPAYPEGVFVAQDGENAPLAQNFKLVGWREIRMAIGQ